MRKLGLHYFRLHIFLKFYQKARYKTLHFGVYYFWERWCCWCEFERCIWSRWFYVCDWWRLLLGLLVAGSSSRNILKGRKVHFRFGRRWKLNALPFNLLARTINGLVSWGWWYWSKHRWNWGAYCPVPSFNKRTSVAILEV